MNSPIRSVRRLALVAVCLCVFVPTVGAQGEGGSAPIDPVVLAEFDINGEATFWVVLREQADLSLRLPALASRDVGVPPVVPHQVPPRLGDVHDNAGHELGRIEGLGSIAGRQSALDTASGMIYWADTIGHSINRGPMDGNGPVENLYSEGLVDPWDIELDLEERKVYWVERGGARICRGDMDGSGPREVILSSADGLERPQGLGLDVAHGKMYWADSENQSIRRAGLDGSAIEDLVTTGLAYPADLELDLTRELVSRHHGTPEHPEMPPQLE